MPSTGFFFRHVKNLELSHIEIATERPDDRPAFALVDVAGADFFRVRVPRTASSPAFHLEQVSDFRVFGSQFLPDVNFVMADEKTF